MPLSDNNKREEQLRNCFYYLLYHNDYLTIQCIEQHICEYAQTKKMEPFAIFTTLEHAIYASSAYNKEFYAVFLRAIISTQGQNDFKFRELERRLKSKHCDKCSGTNTQTQEMLQKNNQLLTQTLRKYKKKEIEQEERIQLFMTEVTLSKKQNVELINENKQLKEKLKQFKEGFLNVKLLDINEQLPLKSNSSDSSQEPQRSPHFLRN